MFEKVNPNHPDKVADRIAGAIVDLAYKKSDNPKIAVEVLLGHNECFVINETDVDINKSEVNKIVKRIAGKLKLTYLLVNQDPILHKNQERLRCGDNGIFKGCPVTDEQKQLTGIVKKIYKKCPFDGKYILDDKDLICCQSHLKTEDLVPYFENYNYVINPLGY